MDVAEAVIGTTSVRGGSEVDVQQPPAGGARIRDEYAVGMWVRTGT